MIDLTEEIDEQWPALVEAFERVARSGRFILGREVAAFESEVAAYLGAAHAIGVNSGTDALIIALRASGVAPGDEVITSPFTFFATVEAIDAVGAVPVFVDVDPATLNISFEHLEAAISSRSSAVIPIHLFGAPARILEIAQVAAHHDMAVVEDVAQAFGAAVGGRRLGTFADAGAFSFFPSKNLGAFGDGGLIATSDPRVAEEARMLRSHGGRAKYENEMFGYNSRLDELQAALLRVRLPAVEANNEARRRAAAAYVERLGGLPGIDMVGERCEGHVYHQFTLRISDGRRDQVRARMAEVGVQTMIYYPTPVHRLPVLRDRSARYPEAERAASEVLSLPIWPRISIGCIDRVVDALRLALAIGSKVR